jgi:uncharacterized protein RhaS with RHS repeats
LDRYYDPNTDQFLTVDPDLAQTGQAYAFTGDDPLNSTDPLGLAGAPNYAPRAACGKNHNLKSKACKTYRKNDPIGSLAKLVKKHWRGEVQIVGVAATITAAVATGGSSLAVEETAEALVDTADVASKAASTASSTTATVANVVGTGTSIVGCATGSGAGRAVSCAGIGINGIGTALGMRAEAAVAGSNANMLNNMWTVFGAASILPTWATSTRGN